MYKIKKTLISILCLVPLITFAKEQYDPNDLKKFQSTGICVECDLRYVTLYGNHPHANVKGSALTGTSTILKGDDGWDYTASDFSNITGFGINFSGDRFTRSIFIHAMLKDANFSGCDLTDTSFAGADVSGVNFASANLYGSNLSVVQLATVSSVCGAILPNGDTGECNGNAANN